MNPDKTQFIWLGSRQQLAHLNITPLHLHDGTIVVPSTDVRSLGFVFDSQLSMTDHVNRFTRACFYQLRQLRFIRDSLTDDAAKMLVHALVSSRVDYYNSLLFGAPTHVLRKLQYVLSASARLITRGRRSDHITPVLRDLHWLSVAQRIDYKLALLVYKCLHDAGPSYLTAYCTALSTVNRHDDLRSAARGDLAQPRTRTRRLGTRSFCLSGPSVWNSLPPAKREHRLTLNQFKALLKQHLFNIAYYNT